MKEEIKELSPYESIINIQSAIEGLKKDTNNPFFKSNYINLGSIVNTIKPILHQNNCFTTHEIIEEDSKIKLWSKICYKDGSVLLQCKSPLLTKDPNDPQKLGSAITYMRRYNLTAMLELEEDDDDGNEASKVQQNMKETLRKKNEEDFKQIKIDIESCNSVIELQSIWEGAKKEINSLKKYKNDLYSLLIEAKDLMKESLNTESQQHNIMQAG